MIVTMPGPGTPGPDITIPAQTIRTPATTTAMRWKMLRCLWRALRSRSLIEELGSLGRASSVGPLRPPSPCGRA